jgi:hypothetical protein
MSTIVLALAFIYILVTIGFELALIVSLDDIDFQVHPWPNFAVIAHFLIGFCVFVVLTIHLLA